MIMQKADRNTFAWGAAPMELSVHKEHFPPDTPTDIECPACPPGTPVEALYGCKDFRVMMLDVVEFICITHGLHLYTWVPAQEIEQLWTHPAIETPTRPVTTP